MRAASSKPLVALLAGGFSIWGALLSLRFSYADWLFRRNDRVSAEKAVALDPDNGAYHAWLVELQEHDGRDPRPELELASRLNPLDSHLWIERGLRAESDGDYAEAERMLLHAAEIDRLFEPRWALLNFYFRRGNPGQFWPWAKQAFAISYGDRIPLFDLCWRMRADSSLIASLAPDDRARRQLVNFLLSRRQIQAASSLAEALLTSATQNDRSMFLSCVDRSVESGKVPQAVRIWNGLCTRHLLPFAALDPPRGAWLTNGSFETFPTNAGFDWHISSDPELTAIHTQTPQGLRISLSGKQPDSCRLLRQSMPLEPRRRYRFHFAYLTAGISPGDGLLLKLPGTESEDLSSATWRESSIDFTSGGESLNAVAFEYHRPLGHVRAAGSLSLRNLRLELIP